MSVFKEINKADGSGVTQFFRLSSEKQTVETHDYGDFYNFKGSVASESDLPTTKLEVGDAYFIEDEEKTVFWDGTQWLKIDAHVLNYNYNDASNKPLINGHILQGNKTAADLELQPAGDYLTEIPSEYITEGELEDYDYATKTYVIEQINNTEHFHREIVTGLPVIGKDNIIYMIKKEGATGEDIYDEYMWVGTKYEHIGSTATDLTDYYKKGEVDSLLEGKVSTRNGFDLSSNDYTTAEKTKLASLENYDDSTIWSAVNALHNYDDTEVRQDITALKTAENSLKIDVKDIQEELKDKVEYIRLVRAGDKWNWQNTNGDNIFYETARDLLGQEKYFLVVEDIENDGKILPARYDIDEELIHVWYTDMEGEDHYIQMGYPEVSETAVGINSLTYDDAKAFDMLGANYKGNVEQQTYSGKNLFDKSHVEWYRNNSTIFDYKADDNTLRIITAPFELSGGTYVISGIPSKYSLNTGGVKCYDENKTYLGDKYALYTDNSFTLPSQVKYIKIMLNGTDLTNEDKIILKNADIQIEEGTQVTPYEPYVGGIPSPNPDYPQEVETLKGYNLFGGTTKNLGISAGGSSSGIDAKYIGTGEYIPCKPNTTYSVLFEENEPKASLNIAYKDINGEFIQRNGEGSNRNFTTPNNAYSMFVYQYYPTSTFREGTYMQIVEGVIRPYVPYGKIGIMRTGKNLFNGNSEPYIKRFTTDVFNFANDVLTISKTNSTSQSRNFWVFPCNANENYTISCVENANIGIAFSNIFPRNDVEAQSYSYSSKLTTQEKGYIIVRLIIPTADLIATFTKLQLEKNSVATPYEPYQEKIDYIDLQGNEVLSTDEIELRDGKIKLHKEYGKYILDGVSNKFTTKSGQAGNCYTIEIPDAVVGETATVAPAVYSNYYIPVSWNDRTNYLDNGVIFRYVNASNYVLRFGTSSSITTLDKANQFLVEKNESGNPVIIYYKKAVPEEIELADSYIESLEGTNNVEILATLEPVYMKETYAKSTNYNDKKLGIQKHILPHANVLPESGNPGDMISIGSDRTWYIWEDNAWIIIDKGGSVDLSNYLAKDNTTGYAPTGNYNPATKKYVDDSVAAIHVPTKTSQLTNDSNYVTKTSNDLTYYYTKSNTYTKAEVNALIAGGGKGGTSDYPDLTNKPSINGVELNGNKTTSDLGLFSGAYADLTGTPTIPTRTSDLTNDSNYEVNTNKTTYVNSLSTDDQYPSAKAVYNAINNKYAKDGEIVFGWYQASSPGTNMTETYGLTKDMLFSFKIGDYVEWPSNVDYSTTNGAMIVGMDSSYGYKEEGGRYYTRTMYVGRNGLTAYTYAYDLEEGGPVYKDYWGGSSGGLACFTGDTLILTEQGETKIEDLSIGDKVLSANTGANIIEPKPITNIISHDANNLVTITTGKTTVTATTDHPFSVKDKGKVPASLIEAGDILIDNERKEVKVSKIEKVSDTTKVYEIVVEDNHNYYVGKKHVLVYNEPSIIK